MHSDLPFVCVCVCTLANLQSLAVNQEGQGQPDASAKTKLFPLCFFCTQVTGLGVVWNSYHGGGRYMCVCVWTISEDVKLVYFHAGCASSSFSLALTKTLNVAGDIRADQLEVPASFPD